MKKWICVGCNKLRRSVRCIVCYTNRKRKAIGLKPLKAYRILVLGLDD